MDNEFGPLAFFIGTAAASICWAFAITPANTAYTKGITDCQQGTTSYTVTVGPEGVDTTYVYKP